MATKEPRGIRQEIGSGRREATHQDAAREEVVLRVNDLFQRHLVIRVVLLVVRKEVLEPQLLVRLFVAVLVGHVQRWVLDSRLESRVIRGGVFPIHKSNSMAPSF